jgi:hypothetical protein
MKRQPWRLDGASRHFAAAEAAAADLAAIVRCALTWYY